MKRFNLFTGLYAILYNYLMPIQFRQALTIKIRCPHCKLEANCISPGRYIRGVKCAHCEKPFYIGAIYLAQGSRDVLTKRLEEVPRWWDEKEQL